ncbi:MAG: shikimate kinase [Nitrospirae bacterium]|nr:shikimate kinase [Nitrospirota bacterium]
MGSGKTAVGKLLAKRLGYEFIDTDSLIEKNEGKSISAIFSEDGEERFRDLEAKTVRELSDLQGHIISTGGGIVINKDNIANLKKNGLIIWLKATPETIIQRVGSQTHRPLLNIEDPLEKIKTLLTFREPFYAEADLSIDTDGLELEEIVEIIFHKFSY